MSDWFNTAVVVLDEELHNHTLMSCSDLYERLYGEYEFELLKNCEQVSEVWLKARKHRLSGSVVANVHQIKINDDKTFTVLPEKITKKVPRIVKAGYDSSDKQVKYMINPTSKYINPIYTTWGRENEHRVEECFIDWMEKKGMAGSTHHYGFVIDKENPHMGYSPDGVVKVGDRRDLLEFKCPYTKPEYPELTMPDGNVAKIAISHWFQVQLGMSIMGRAGLITFPDAQCHYVAMSRKGTYYVETIKYDPVSVANIISRCRNFIMEEYLPAYQEHLRSQEGPLRL